MMMIVSRCCSITFLSGEEDKSDAAAGDKRKEGGLSVKG